MCGNKDPIAPAGTGQCGAGPGGRPEQGGLCLCVRCLSSVYASVPMSPPLCFCRCSWVHLSIFVSLCVYFSVSASLSQSLSQSLSRSLSWFLPLSFFFFFYLWSVSMPLTSLSLLLGLSLIVSPYLCLHLCLCLHLLPSHTCSNTQRHTHFYLG